MKNSAKIGCPVFLLKKSKYAIDARSVIPFHSIQRE
jgi:hypothetical protein